MFTTLFRNICPYIERKSGHRMHKHQMGREQILQKKKTKQMTIQRIYISMAQSCA